MNVLALAIALFTGTLASNAPAPAPAVDLPAVLNLQNALDLFRQRGFDLLIADATLDSAAADVQIAGAVSNLQAAGQFGKSFYYPCSPDIPGCSDWLKGGQLTDQGALVDVLSGKRGLRVAVAKAAYEAAKHDRADASRSLESLLKQTFLQVVVAGQTLDFTRQTQVTLAHTADLFTLRYKAGQVSETDLARVETAALESEQVVDQAIAAERETKLALAFLLGVRGLMPDYDVEATWLDKSTPARLESMQVGELIELAMQNRPDLASARFQRESAERGVSSAYRLRVPDISLQLGYNEEGRGLSAINPPTLTFGLTLTLPVFYQYQGEVNQALANLRSEQVQYAKAEAQVANDVGNAFADFTSARSRIERMRTRLRSRAARALELVQIQYDKGAASLLDLLDARRTHIAITLEYFDDLTDYWTAVFQLEQAVAMELKS